jgi:hypothetical protein
LGLGLGLGTGVGLGTGLIIASFPVGFFVSRLPGITWWGGRISKLMRSRGDDSGFFLGFAPEILNQASRLNVGFQVPFSFHWTCVVAIGEIDDVVMVSTGSIVVHFYSLVNLKIKTQKN